MPPWYDIRRTSWWIPEGQGRKWNQNVLCSNYVPEARPSLTIFKRKTGHFCSDFSFLYFSHADHHNELIPGLLGFPLSFSFHLLSFLSSWVCFPGAPTAMSCFLETWQDGGLSLQLPSVSWASPSAKRTFFSQFSCIREGIWLALHESISLSLSLCLVQGDEVLWLGHIGASCPPTLSQKNGASWLTAPSGTHEVCVCGVCICVCGRGGAG